MKKVRTIKPIEEKTKEAVKPKEISSGRAQHPDVYRIVVETMLKEEKCREKFHENAMYYRKSRNPCNGELTARDDAEFLIPVERTIQTNFETEKFLEFDRTYNSIKESTQPAVKDSLQTIRKLDVIKIGNIRERKQMIDSELEQMRKIVAYKQQQLHALSK
jgi:hypothetical protein